MEYKCSFCGKDKADVRNFIEGDALRVQDEDVHVFICDECVRLCYEVALDAVEDEGEESFSGADITDPPVPRDIKTFLDSYVIGQDKAKQSISVAVYNHYKRLHKNTAQDVEISKSNILFLGPTGSGKTLLAQTLARFLDIPFCIVDATSLTEAGYVGEDVENIILKLVQAADGDIARAQRGIIFIDEIDKISRKSDNASITRDVSGEGVQQALLKIIEGTVANIPPQGGRKHPQQEYIQVDTRDILFICGGAFSGLEKIINDRLDKGSIGFNVSVKDSNAIEDNVLFHVESEDLQKFGLISELIGRLPVISVLEELSEEALLEVLTKPKNAIVAQYKALFALDGVELKIDKAALKEVVRIAVDKKVGARGLRSILEKYLEDVMYEIPSRKDVSVVHITKQCIAENKKPLYTIGVEKKAQ